MNYMLLIKS